MCGQPAGWGVSARFFYVFLLAFVFPFICWGGEGKVGHPHRRAHFVFLAPPGVETTGYPRSAPTPTTDHSGHLGMASSPAQEEAAGQSTPDTLSIFVLLLLVSGSALWLFYTPTYGQKLHRIALGMAQTTPRLPFPPPRFA